MMGPISKVEREFNERNTQRNNERAERSIKTALRNPTFQRAHDEMKARTRKLMRSGAIEKLVAQGRTPRLFGDPAFICQIPPEGVQPGDTAAFVASDDIVLEFFSPDGQSRGRETSVHISPTQARRISERIARFSATIQT